MYDILKRKGSGLNERATSFAQELVRIPSPSLQEGKVAERVQVEMMALGYDKVVSDEHGNVVGILYGRQNAPTILLNCHMDTMPAGDASKWKDSPNAGTIADGKLHGLGASDCKGGLAGEIMSLALLKRSLLPLKGNLIVAATVGEEKGGSSGVRGLMEHTLPSLKLKADYAILGEPTELSLYYGHDGWAELEINVQGSNMFSVDDAASAIYTDINNRGQGGSQREEFSAKPPRFETDNGFRRATITMNRRLNEADQIAQVMRQIEHEAVLVAKQSGEVAVNVAVREEQQKLYTGRTTVVRHVVSSWAIDPFHFLLERARQTLGAAGCNVKCGKWQLGCLGMGTAGGVLVNDYQVPTIGYGPGSEDSCHAPNEYVETSKVAEAIYGTASIVHGLIGVPVFGWTADEI